MTTHEHNDKPRDVHRETAARIFDIPESEVTPEQRFEAKRANFMLSHGSKAARHESMTHHYRQAYGGEE